MYDECEYEIVEHYGNIEKHPCNRDCGCNKRPKLCKYILTLESFVTDQADGRMTYTVAFNGTVPGPAIKVCRGDMVAVTILNNSNSSTTIHWHGMLMRKTLNSDGVPYVTQYSIRPGTSFLYKFHTNEQSGTFWYHPHLNDGRCFGAVGALIIKETCQRPRKCEEQIVFLSDLNLYNNIETPDNILINGKGIQPGVPYTSVKPFAQIEVPKNTCIRFRFINNFCTRCYLTLYIPGISFTVVASDGQNLKSYRVESILTLSGERYDAIVKFPKGGYYWLNVNGTGCNLFQGMLIKVRGSVETSNIFEGLNRTFPLNGIQFNAFDRSSRNPESKVSDIPIAEAERCSTGKENDKEVLTKYIAFNLGSNNGTSYAGINGISFMFSKPYSMLDVLDVDSIDKNKMLCTTESQLDKNINCAKTPGICKCPHVIYFDCDKTYELVVFSYLPVAHPFHIHGTFFSVIGQGAFFNSTFLNNLPENDKSNPLPRKSSRKAALKDTVIVPPSGYAIIRFKVDNPGFWFSHCHFESHSNEGMAFVAVFCLDKIKKSTTLNNCDKSQCSKFDYRTLRNMNMTLE